MKNYFINDLLSDEYANRTYKQAEALFNYYEEFDYVGKFDRVAIRCEWDAYDNIEEIKGVYDDIETIEDLQYHTQVIKGDDFILIVAY